MKNTTTIEVETDIKCNDLGETLDELEKLKQDGIIADYKVTEGQEV